MKQNRTAGFEDHLEFPQLRLYALSMEKQPKESDCAQFIQWFGPILEALRRLGGSATPEEVTDQVAEDLNISNAQLNEVLPSGQLRFSNQIRWAKFYLLKEGLLICPKRGIWSLTERGQTTLSLDQSKAIFRKWTKIFADERRKLREVEPVEESTVEGTGAASNDYRQQLLLLLQSLPPEGFERLSQRLLRESGFTQVTVTGRSGDGGIDGYGILQINPLVSFRVLFQCKRYQGTVSPSQVRDFRGAMTGRADKGIVITTGTFTSDARREASRDGAPPIELIDGEKLLDMFEELELGLKPRTTYEIEEKFFQEFQIKTQLLQERSKAA